MQLSDRLVSKVFFIAAVVIVLLETGLMYEGAKDGDWLAYGNPRNLWVAGFAALIGVVVRYQKPVGAWLQRWRSR
jgi:hypothetical protein